MKKIRLIMLFTGLLMQQLLWSQELGIKEFMQLNPSVLRQTVGKEAGKQQAGHPDASASEIKPKSRDTGNPTAGPRYEKVRLLLPGNSAPQEYTVRIESGKVFLTDDIALFTEADYELKKLEKGNYVTFTNLRWPGGRIPYTIPFDHGARNLILSAIDHINANTNLCMVPRTTETNYVEFIDNESACWSYVGMVGTGKQEINVVSACGFGGILHEILHAAGMWHEQSRNDRDDYVTINWENISTGAEINFQKEGAGITPVGAYDYGSLMHYGSTAFSKNGSPTITVKVPPAAPGTTIGQRIGLSSGDVASVAAMYPTKSCTAPAVTYISLTAPITANPNPIVAGQPFTVTTNFLNTGTTVFDGCYHVVIWDRRGENVEAILPAIQEDSLPPNATYPSLRVFSGAALNLPTGEYILAVYFRNNCTGEYIFAGNENFPSVVLIQVNGTNNLSVSPTSVSFSSSGGTQSLAVTSNTSWTITGKPDWITLSAASGSNSATVSATAAPNGTASVRNATLTFSASGVTSRTVSISQQAATTALSVSPSSVSFAAAGGGQVLSVTSNTTWSVSESLSWITLSTSGGANNGTVTVNCAANTETTERSGVITFSGVGALTQTVTVTQVGTSVFLNVSPSILSYGATGSFQNLNIASNTTWTITESLDWVSLSTTSGSNNGTVVVTCTTNNSSSERSGTLTVNGTGASAQTVTISQSGNSLTLTLSTNSLSFLAGGGNATFDITSNTTWNVSPSASWVTVNQSAGANNGTITVTCAPNTTTSSRTANVSVWGTGVATQLVIITQAAQSPFLSVSPSTLNYNAPGGSQTINVSSNTTWTVAESLSWLSVEPGSGANNGSFSVVCSANTTSSNRSGTITVSATGVPSQTITVNQTATAPVCGVPANLVLVQKDYSWFYVRWDQVPNVSLYSWRFRAVTESTWRTSDSWGSLGLISMAKLPCTEYIFQVRSVCADTFSAWSPELRFTLDGCGDAYCYSYGSSVGDWIARVSFAGISQVSSYDYGYVNRTSVRGTVTAGNSFPLSLIGGFDSDSQGSTYHWKVWIDLNRDNDFSDSGELLFNQTFSRSASVGGISGNIAIPASAAPGITRMRVSLSLDPADGPCSTGPNFREIEDYGLEIQSGGAFLALSPNSMNFNSGGGNQNLSVSSNTNWTVSDTVNWITLAPSSGTNNGTVVVTCAPNTSTVSRVATITATGTGVSPQTVTVSQAGASLSLSVSPTALNFTAPGGTNTLAITSNTSWTLADTLSWIDLDISTGSDNGVITVTCQPNTTGSLRTGTIIVFGTGVPVQTVTVSQAAASSSLSVTPSSLSYNASGGTQSLMIESNTTWSLSDTMAWVSFVPASGSNNGIVQVVCTPNNGNSARSGNIVVSGTGVANQIIAVSQSGLSEVLEVTPSSLNAGPQVGSLSLSIVNNSTWTASEAVDWITLGSLSGSGNASLAVNFAQNTQAQARTAVITVSTGGGTITRTISVTQRASGEVLPVSWNFKRTENNHTVILQSSLISSIAGQPLAPGDYIGVFYTVSGTDICAGNGAWTGSSTSFPVYGDDGSTTEKDGMGNGEAFKVKVWRGATQQTVDVNATYAPIGTAGIVNAGGAYLTDGFTMITQLNFTAAPNIETLPIPLKAGWNTISSFIVPQKPSFDTIIKPMTDVIQVVKDGDGKTFLVALNLNGIGTWEVTQGYRVQVSADDTLFISGLPVNTLSTPIQVRTGWQIIPVFSRNPIAPATALATLNGVVDVLKDNEGKVYIPDLSINTIGQLIPTQGYRLKAKSSGELRYPALVIDPTRGEPLSGSRRVAPEFFKLPSQANTGANATLVFLATGLSDVLAPGDEIGIFSQDGRLCGAGKIDGGHLAMAVWGDDATRQGKQGLLNGERFSLRAWRKSDGQTFELEAKFSTGTNEYREDELSIVELVKPLNNFAAEHLRLFPNPGNGQFTLIPEQSFAGPVELKVLDAAGKIIFLQRFPLGWEKAVPQRLDVSSSPSGVYFVQVISESGIWTKRVSLVK